MQSEPGNHQRPTGPPPPPENHHHLQCPRCNSTNTKFCYYNNYNLSQPRHFCKSCRRYWTHGGALRDIPARDNAPKRSRSRSSPVTPPLASYPPQRVPPDLNVGASGSFTRLLNSHGSEFSGLGAEYGLGSGLHEVGDGGAWQIGIGEEVELVEGNGFTWPDIHVSAPGRILKE
ncbi:hypothetical protein VitviT2T_003450 [Vitis vinifera]|uniref:Dof zinc finger protein n=2 Tax=Vitis vinifera TaxID=29760 RepID=A0ABY9BN43_VITVI|eukprot:XP_010647796.1 PREDICTED: dof zinc finger protein DOF1.6-like [Vitis vinifera]